MSGSSPTSCDEFQLQVLRRNLNIQFSGAEPLPRSVAAVFERVDYPAIRNDGFTVLVVDSGGGTTYAAKLIASYDAELHERVPETRGFYMGALAARDDRIRRGTPRSAD